MNVSHKLSNCEHTCKSSHIVSTLHLESCERSECACGGGGGEESSSIQHYACTIIIKCSSIKYFIYTEQVNVVNTQQKCMHNRTRTCRIRLLANRGQEDRGSGYPTQCMNNEIETLSS